LVTDGQRISGGFHPDPKAFDPMPDLLLELFSEEIPARMQRKAAADLKTLVTNALGGCRFAL
jgi:hypothetical protein